MRTIKYRGKDSFYEWVYGSLVSEEVANDNGKFMVAFIAPSVPCASNGRDMWTAKMKRVQPETVGQFTGLFDKNGEEIYEEDIVRFTRWNGELATGLVKWDNCNPCMCIEYKTEYKQTDWEFDFIKCGTMKIEVIGNIHDNPELIKS